MLLPKKRERIRSGILREPPREWPRHRKFVRSHACCIEARWNDGRFLGCGGPIVFAHVRTGTDGGSSLKPSDWWGISLCNNHHLEQHDMGEPAFERHWAIDMKALAREFAAKSPDMKMREAMRASLLSGG